MRQVLALGGLALLLAATSACPGGGGTGTTDCPGAYCNEVCVNLMVDSQNCGSCGRACLASERCEMGSCVSTCGSLTACSGSCVDTRNNPNNCGGCGTTCPSGICTNGLCQSDSCDVGLTDCSGSCVDTDNDPDNCGRCGNSCDSPCYQGECQSGCPSGFENCSGSCVDTDKDEANCGGCGNACAEGETCTGGECSLRCPPDFTACDGGCVDLDSDLENCGRCGNFCNAGEVCNGGSCNASGCSSGLTDCSGSCVDTNTNPSHCGGCGVTCPAGEACTGGDCGILCPSGQTVCGSACVNLTSDEANCGGCGTACRADESCESGDCRCPGERTECSGRCVDTRNDPANCGSCGTSCSGAEACVNGDCTVSCPSGTTACSGYCVDTTADRSHCGSCTNACSDGQSCVGGICVAGGITDGDSCLEPIDVTGGGRFTGSTAAASADYAGGCGGTSGRDVVFRYTLTATTDVSINTFNTDFDTVVYVRRDPCGGGTELACNDDARDTFQSELILLDQPAGTYYIFLDGYATSSSGPYALDVYFSSPSSRGGDACGEPEWLDIATATSFDGNTCPWYWTNYRDDARPSCAYGTGGLDIVYYFVVESTTTVTFATCDGVDWDSVLDLRRVCNDPTSSVTCNDDGCAPQSTINATLEPGVYYLWLDGYSEDECGGYEVSVTRS